MSLLYILFTLLAESLWLYAFTNRLRSEPGKNFTARDLFHKVLNNILPFSVLVFGYAILLDAFRLNQFASAGQNIEFYIRGITGIVFITAYVYLFYELVNQLNSVKSSMTTKPPNDTWTTNYPDNKATKFDNVLDILYNLFQPLSIIVIASIMYFIIRSTNTGVVHM